ncbi:uncharacterized protein K441DRAFT_689152 [Cenococcum geophilum 1.58]|uniref:uncharacterized protein n=1 Tax=Cenococcum geophilum 1.58 TaxID=794803 RepID=UPI003590233C|nr:hypothetical protein K441DRAFT_689152 [Cenococcum geophilum 1.58]
MYSGMLELLGAPSGGAVHLRGNAGSVASSDAEQRKRSSIGRAAGSLHSKIAAPFKCGKKKVDQSEDGEESTLLFDLFFHLPNELHIQILCELSISDILALRITSRFFNNLVLSCQSALVRFWVKYRLGSLHTSLYPAPPPNHANIHYLLAMRRRHIASIRLTRQLANYVLKDTLRYTSARQRKMWNSVYDKMIPLVFAVGYFLDEHRRVILERDLKIGKKGAGYDFQPGPAITKEEKKIIERYDPRLRLPYFYMYSFILQVLTRKLRPPTYAGSVERFVRGWNTAPATSDEIAFALVLGGVDQVAKLLACKKYYERRRVLDEFIKGLSPKDHVCWKENWKVLDVESPAISLDSVPWACICVTKLDLIWEPVIMELMSPRSKTYTKAEKARFTEVKASRGFVSELMGYDILRGRPDNGGDSEAEAEDGEEMQSSDESG